MAISPHVLNYFQSSSQVIVMFVILSKIMRIFRINKNVLERWTNGGTNIANIANHALLLTRL